MSIEKILASFSTSPDDYTSNSLGYKISCLIEGYDLLYRRVSSHLRAIPNCFILGVPKAGTTSLAEYLNQHPNYISAFDKEINFLHELNFKKKYQDESIRELFWSDYNKKGDKGYRMFFPYDSALKKIELRSGFPAYTGDHTPWYFYCPVALKRIRELSPNAKLIILLRDPVKRAYSHYVMNLILHRIDKRTFEKAIREELSGKRYNLKLDYLNAGIYYPRLKAIYDIFPHENIKVIQSESFFKNTSSVLQDLYGFLGLPTIALPSEFTVEHRGFYKKGLSDEMKLKLQAYFDSYNHQLYDFLGREFLWT